MTVTLAFDSFKGSLRSDEVADAFAQGLCSVLPGLYIKKVYIADGGEGTAEALIRNLNGEFVHAQVCDPLGRRITARYGIVEKDRTAVIEMAAASGLTLLSAKERNPLSTHTFGTGQLIADALGKGCQNFFIGIGGSATVDGGVGMLQALGYRFWRADGSIVPDGAGGGVLNKIVRIDGSCADPLLKNIQIKVASDVNNVLCGEHGSAAVFGPQKGATPEMVKILDENLRHFAGLFEENGDVPGDGAAGGLGFALRMIGGQIESGAKIVMRETGFAAALDGADLVITGEGCSDDQTACGKLCAAIALEAKAAGVSTVLVSGALRGDCTELEKLFAGCFSISRGVSTLEDALKDTAVNLEKCTASLAAFSGGLGN